MLRVEVGVNAPHWQTPHTSQLVLVLVLETGKLSATGWEMSKEEKVTVSQVWDNDYAGRKRLKHLMMWLIWIVLVLPFPPNTSKSSQQIQAEFILPREQHPDILDLEAANSIQEYASVLRTLFEWIMIPNKLGSDLEFTQFSYSNAKFLCCL